MPLLIIELMAVHKEAIYSFLVGNNDKYMSIAWQSKCIRRVVNNTLAAEILAMIKELSLPYYLSIAGGRIIVFIPLPRVLVLCEMQTALFRI